MSSNGSKPSKWWFWGGVALWNGYLLALEVVSFCMAVFTGGHLQPMPLFTTPAEFFSYLCRPLWELFFPAATETFPAAFLLSILLWELGAMVLGLACYGAVLLVYTLFPHGQGKDGQQQRQLLAKEEVRAMPGERGRRPSKWWFWGVVAGANAYAVLAGVTLVFGLHSVEGYAFGILMVFSFPAMLFMLRVASLAGSGSAYGAFGLGVLLWELLAVLLGLACYGLAALCARRATERKQSNGSQA